MDCPIKAACSRNLRPTVSVCPRWMFEPIWSYQSAGDEGRSMKKVAMVAAAMLSIGVFSSPAEAQSRLGGCLKYGLGGAVAGHVAGGHRLKGALAGCALGVYQRNKLRREVRERNRNRTVERGPPSRERADRYQEPGTQPGGRGRTPERGPYEDLGLPSGREQTNRRQGDIRSTQRGPEGFERGGSFARPQFQADTRSRNTEPDQTGAVSRNGSF